MNISKRSVDSNSRSVEAIAKSNIKAKQSLQSPLGSKASSLKVNGDMPASAASSTCYSQEPIPPWVDDIGDDFDLRQYTPKKSHSRKLVLHFDVRNTVLVADSIGGFDITRALNGYLSGVTWGKSTSKGWVWSCNYPSLCSPVPGDPEVITYYKFLERKIVKKQEDMPF